MISVFEGELFPRFDYAKSFYGKAHVRIDTLGAYVLTSYDTDVARYWPGNCYCVGGFQLSPEWDCSQTTLRHVKEFIRQIVGYRTPLTKSDIEKHLRYCGTDEAYWLYLLNIDDEGRWIDA